MRFAWLPILLALTLSAGAAPVRSLAPDDINGAEFNGGKNSEAVNIRAQVLLDRARFSPGVIDGHRGENFSNALRAYQEQLLPRHRHHFPASTGRSTPQPAEMLPAAR